MGALPDAVGLAPVPVEVGAVALAAARNFSKVLPLAAVGGLMAKTIPEEQWLVWAQ